MTSALPSFHHTYVKEVHFVLPSKKPPPGRPVLISDQLPSKLLEQQLINQTGMRKQICKSLLQIYFPEAIQQGKTVLLEEIRQQFLQIYFSKKGEKRKNCSRKRSVVNTHVG